MKAERTLVLLVFFFGEEKLVMEKFLDLSAKSEGFGRVFVFKSKKIMKFYLRRKTEEELVKYDGKASDWMYMKKSYVLLQ